MLDKIQNVYKFKKIFKKKIKNYKFNDIKIGIIGVRALESGRITPKQLETVRRVVVRQTQRTGKFWLRAHIDQPLTKKSKGSRMGKGAGSINSWVLDIKVGQVIFEISASPLDEAQRILRGASKKFPMKTDLVSRQFLYKKWKW